MICRWAQELLGYQFGVIHRHNRMMADVDALTRRFGHLLATHYCISSLLHERNRKFRPEVFERSMFHSNTKSKMTQPKHTCPTLPALTSTFLKSAVCMTSSNNADSNDVILSSSPILFHTSDDMPNAALNNQTIEPGMKIMSDINYLFSEWCIIDDMFGSPQYSSNSHTPISSRWNYRFLFSSATTQRTFHLLYSSQISSIVDLATLVDDQDFSNVTVFDVTYVQNCSFDIMTWYKVLGNLFQHTFKTRNCLRLIMLWIHERYFPPPIKEQCIAVLQEFLPTSWILDCKYCHASRYGDTIDTCRYVIHISNIPHTLNLNRSTSHSMGYGKHIYDHNEKMASIQNLALHAYDHTSHCSCTARVVAVVHCSTGRTLETFASSNYILDTQFSAMEPSCREYDNSILGRRFGIPFHNDSGTHSRQVENVELLRCYSIPPALLQETLNSSFYTTLFDDYIHYCTPHHLRNLVTRALLDHVGFSDDIAYGNSECSDNFQCYYIGHTPTALDWTKAYDKDNSTNLIITHLKKSTTTTWPSQLLSDIDVEYRQRLLSNRIQLIHDKLVLYKPIFKDIKYVGLIIVPSDLRRKIFSHYHAGPSGGHMGEYKTLFRIRMRFFWPGIRRDIKFWVKSCAYCCAYNIWCNRKSEVYFSWPVTTPFYIMHVDLWMPGKLTDEAGETLQLMNAMCDLTQFIVSIVVSNANSTVLAKLFMEQVVLTFGMVAVVVVDADSKFLGNFSAMCDILDIKLWPLTRGNHKGLSVERYHRFLNQTQTIAGQDRGTHQSVIENSKTSQYAWNSAPIDDTGIPRSLAAIGRHFKFPLDVELNPEPQMNNERDSALYYYLRNVSNDSHFATSILQVLV